MKKQLRLIILLGLVALVLAGCGVQTGNYLTADSASGWWQIMIILPLIQFVTWLTQLTGSLGIAIILATIFSRLIVLPLTLHVTKSTAARNALNPKVEKIKQKYHNKNDQESKLKMQQEIHKMYQENGVSIMAGCLPQLIQMPMMIAFFQAFSRHPFIVGAEVTYFLGVNLASVSLMPNYILAIMVAALMYYSQKRLQANNPDPSAATMSAMNLPLAIMIGSFVILSPLAMGLYFLVSQIVTVLQGTLIKKPAVATT